MDEFTRFMMLGGFGSTMDGVAVFAFFAMATFYLVAPALGYRPERRHTLILPLYLMIGYAGVCLLQSLVQYTQFAEKGGRGPNELSVTVHFVFVILKMLAFTTALLVFVIGLQVLRLKGETPARKPRSVRPEDEDEELEEDHADEELTRALDLNRQGRRAEAIEGLERLLSTYPDTKAAATARGTLRRLRREE